MPPGAVPSILRIAVAEAYDYAAKIMAGNMLVRDAGEGIGAFLEKRKPEWTGS